MSTSQTTIDHLLDQLSSLPNVRARKMFGEYAIYCNEKVVALVCDNQIFAKITAEGKALVGEHYLEGEAYPGAKPSMIIGGDFIDDSERLCELIQATAAALPRPKPKKPRVTKKKQRRQEHRCAASTTASVVSSNQMGADRLKSGCLGDHG